MDNKTEVRIDKELYVNEATVDYLRRCIEAEVKSNFFRWIGLPVGSAGIIVIVLTIFFWIPGKIDTIIATNPIVKETLDQSAIAYLKSERGQQLIQQQIAVTARTQIETYLTSPAVQDLIIKTIDAALKPKIASLSEEIRQNTKKLVIETAMPSHDTKRIDKGTMQLLFDFLNSEEAQSIKKQKRPLALALTVRQGEVYYEFAVIEYLNRLEQNFGQAFSSVLVLDNDGTFIARLEPSLVRSAIGPLMALFNSGPQLPSSHIKARLEQMQGAYCTANVRSHWTVMEALRNKVWLMEGDPQALVPVLDENKIFIGLTSRAKLIKGIVG